MDNIVAVLERNNRPQRDLKFGSGKHFGGDAGAIPGADRSAAQVVWNGGGSLSRLVLGWISPTSANPLLLSPWHPISGIAQTIFVCRSPRHSSPL